MDAHLLWPGEGEHHDAGPAQITIEAGGEHTGGTFFLSESTLAPGFTGPPPHRHLRAAGMLHVLEGALTPVLGNREVQAAPGTFACVPRASCTRSATTATRWCGPSTSALPRDGRSMRALAEAAKDGPLKPEVIGAVASRYDFEAAPSGS